MHNRQTSPSHICPNCRTVGMKVFYTVSQVPAHSVLLMPTREQAVSYPKGDIELALCDQCGFIGNIAFEQELNDYSLKYDGSQSWSPTFNVFNRKLAQGLVERYDLHNKDIIEIGCGQGEFLILLCELGDNRGIGFDPAFGGVGYDPEQEAMRLREVSKDRITLVSDFYSEKYTHVQADFVVCKMTLEHIPQTAEFVSMVRRSIGDRFDTTVFFQVPNASYVLNDLAFWDIYYEHCNYFSRGSLGYLFEQCGFEVLSTATEYNEQYLTIEARPKRLTQVNDSAAIQANWQVLIDEGQQEVAAFISRITPQLQQWHARLAAIQTQNQRAVIWGGGSKGVAFLTTLQANGIVGYAVDVNPHKHGTFMAGSGHEIVGPQKLLTYRPDVVIVMNPVYCNEIQRDLNEMGLHPAMIVV